MRTGLALLLAFTVLADDGGGVDIRVRDGRTSRPRRSIHDVSGIQRAPARPVKVTFK